ncbi:EAL domain-containing protein [Vibrio hannami]|uniref:EAL domain-containing protein n=1 Tax=Vibrio hannami TaxID=2717094 RepID=UPI00240EB5A6|nr:EAL domain-containing protein [Vibrio hannami]MDG3084988.1 EAL domain-containing protein [Vibrio hannami]
MLLKITVDKVILCFLLSLLSYSATSGAAQNTQDELITIQLRWHHQFQFAGYYAALEKGYYKDEGLNVYINAGDPDHQPVSEVLSGRAQYAEGNSEVLYERLKGKPLVALAAIFQHSPSVLLTLESSGIRSVHDLIGKKVMLANEDEDADFLTMFLNEGIDKSQLNILPSSYQLNDLIEGKVDAFNSYTTNEPFVLRQLGLPYNIIDPMNYRVDFYSDILFTTEQEVRDNPERVDAMIRATLKGWRYAMDNPNEIIDLLIDKYKVGKSRAHLEFEAAEMRKLILPDLIKIGHMNSERWQHMTATFIRAGQIENDKYLKGFVYDNSPRPLAPWVFPVLIASLIIAIVASSITFYLHRFNRQMTVAQKSLMQSEERFKALSSATHSGIVIHKGGTLLECNDAVSTLTGFCYKELIGMNGFELIAPEFHHILEEKIEEDITESYEVIGLRRDGSRYPLMVTGKNISFKGMDARVTEFVDITERKNAEEQLKLAASVFTHAREGIMITDKDGTIIEVNETFSQITGYTRDEALGSNPRIFKSGVHESEFYHEMWSSLTNTKQWSGELWNKHRDGSLFAELLTISAVTDTQDKVQNYVALFSDITQKKHHQQQLEHVAHFDALTGLPNRMLLADRLNHAMSQCERRGQSLAVAYLDLDGFKAVNDAYGHSVGDDLLVVLSNQMNGCLREGDTLARIGGDEFVAILADIEQMSDCEHILGRLLEAAMKPVTIKGNSHQVSTSIGVTLYPHDGVDGEQLIRHADQAMYIAKQTGKNRYHLFDVHKDKSIQTQRETIEHIQRGLEQREFVLHYQPKVNMRTGDIVGTEALIRWQHPERGLVFPNDFLPVIENHPISLELGGWVIETAVSQIDKWQAAGLNIPVSVNVDAFQLQDIDFAAKLSLALDAKPMVSPKMLQLEILETSALGDLTEVLSTMNSCIELGVEFALDDFGTGFSSLTYLKRLPVELLKIDQSFVRDMLDDPEDRAIVRGVISLASAFNRKVTAEGVESIDHGVQLLSMGCELAQGYGIAKPMEAESFLGWAKQWKPDSAWQQA